jgi:hypothetical protein
MEPIEREKLRLRFHNVVRRYDEQEERKDLKRGLRRNIYLCAHCLKAVHDIMNEIEDGIAPEVAVKNFSLGKFQTMLLREIKK